MKATHHNKASGADATDKKAPESKGGKRSGSRRSTPVGETEKPGDRVESEPWPPKGGETTNVPIVGIDGASAGGKAESSTALPSDSLVPLDSVLCTEDLNRRPPRPPDYEKENHALTALVQALADSPRTVLQTLADTILEVFQADSVGISY